LLPPDTRDVLVLQSMMRITYSAPRNMHWVTKALQWLFAVQNPMTLPPKNVSLAEWFNPSKERRR